MLDNLSSPRIESDGMERRRNEPLFDTVNAEMAKILEEWHDSPYSSESAVKINTLIQLAQSAGYGITLEIDRKSWEDKNAAKLLPDLRYRIDGDVTIIEIDPQKNADKNETYLYAHVDNPANPLDEYTASYSSFGVVSGGKSVSFAPAEVLSLQIAKERTFRTLKEVKDAFWPDVSDEKFLEILDSDDISEVLIEIINRSTRGIKT